MEYSGDAASVGPKAHKVIVIASAAELTAALKTAPAGATIALETGNYGDFVVNKLVFASQVTITSLHPDAPAVFESVTVLNSQGLRFDQLAINFVPDATTTATSAAVRITGSSNIAVTNSTIIGGEAVNGVDPSALKLDSTGNVLGLPAGRGMFIYSSSDILIQNNDISTFHKGIVLDKATGVDILSNEIHHLRTTPISGPSVTDVTIESNHMHDFSPWRFGGTGDHGDYIHLWTVVGQDGPTQNITIRNNFLDQGQNDPLLGIYLDDNLNLIGFENVLISNNVISNDNAQAIRLERVSGVVEHNTLIQPRASDYHNIPGVLALAGSDIQLNNNLIGRLTVDATSQLDNNGNITITRLEPGSPNYYTRVFVNALPDSPGLDDLQFVPGFSGNAGADISRIEVEEHVSRWDVGASDIFRLADFGTNAGGWASPDRYPREVADVNGDGMADLIGMAEDGVFVSLAIGNGNYGAAHFVLDGFGAGVAAGGWNHHDRYPRIIGDVTGDGRADIVGFGEDGVFVAVGRADGTFGTPTFGLSGFGADSSAGGWNSETKYKRELADVNGDGMADIVGFAEDGVFVALSTGDGRFNTPTYSFGWFGASSAAGGWNDENRYARLLGDINNDGMADIVGFREDGVFVALATGNGQFGGFQFALGDFGATDGWTSAEKTPRALADVDGDGSLDIVGFGSNGVYVAYGNGNATFDAARLEVAAFGTDAGGWVNQSLFPRHVFDADNDGTADIIAFAETGVFVALAHHDIWV